MNTEKPLVKCFDEKALKEEIKKCSPDLQLYIQKLQENAKGWENVAQQAIKKLKEQK
jgi:hypothetical protein